VKTILTNAVFGVAFAGMTFTVSAEDAKTPAGMVWIPGGEFAMGSEDPTSCVCGGKDPMPDDEQWEKFAKATGYRTIAEIAPTKEEFPTAPPENLVAGSTVFTRVHRGGSFLCTDQFCTRYMVSTCGKGEVTTTSNHPGFRCVLTLAQRDSKPTESSAKKPKTES
jgi:formylglycine-generating enzyme required for sulfatase activity